ncbi:hypothetical protein LSH36_122g08000 [Paralvinella palmiformis]|uniref:TLC domain-containing protein n=1 Tax=Paralvinella palmiformis TaxID=53620 RepID=A0AAD9NAI2_9ANNE|nr:hypothetical protein LSH36_122g08000 [Paralvinella palmiformis]
MSGTSLLMVRAIWRFLFYLIAFWYGIAVLWNKQYFWDTRHCWYGYPWQPIPDEIYWYYMIELGFYWSLVLSLFMDVKRKDFVEMIIHHVATIGLMCFSWADGMVRIGTLVLVVHDAVDYWMEGAKLAKYLRYDKLCDVLFVIFASMWFITRIVIYPVRLISCTLNEGHHIVGWFPMYYGFNFLLLVLQALDINWFIVIVRMAHVFITQGQPNGKNGTQVSNNNQAMPTCQITKW